MNDPVIAEVWRDGVLESFHTGVWAVSDPDGRILWSGGDIDRPIFVRSCAKPFQALPLVMTGAADAFGITDEELACICASHNGEPVHLKVVRSILAKIGLDESYLQCGAHAPSKNRIAFDYIRNGEVFSDIHNNCSGKHAGILALSLFIGENPMHYKEPDHPAQLMIRDAYAAVCGIDPATVQIGHDGCDIPAFITTTRQFARAAARFSRPDSIGNPHMAAAIGRITEAILKYPYMIGGMERFCTDLICEARGRAIGKAGAEATYALFMLDRGLGMSAKVNDGEFRALYPFMGKVCDSLGLFVEADRSRLAYYLDHKVTNRVGRVVGSITVPVDVPDPLLAFGGR
jgi:L-asparaginase II